MTADTGFDVCVVGSANLDLVACADRIPRPGETVAAHQYAEHPGGKGLNQAVAAARSGARVAFVGALGDDPAGARLRHVLRDELIDDSCVVTADQPTGRAMIVVDDHAENAIVVVPGANATVEAADLPDSKVVLAQLEVPIDAVERAFVAARQRGARTILNPAPSRSLSPGLIELCDVVIPNEHEVDQLGGPEGLLERGCRAVLVTRGAAGVDLYARDRRAHIDAFLVDPVDTTGAGDAFCGALAARLAAGADLDEAVLWAAAAGALATTTPGAVPAQPSATTIAQLIASQPEVRVRDR